MLKVDLAGASDEEVASAVGERCSVLGTVNKVMVYAARSGAPARPFAIVGMDTRQAAQDVSDAFGGRIVGNAVVVFLQPAPIAPANGGAGREPDNGAVLEKKRPATNAVT